MRQVRSRELKLAWALPREAAVATVVELLEESGLPPVCVAVASPGDARRPLGQVLAEAVQVQKLPCTPATCCTLTLTVNLN